jgi:hypothetical protein
MPLESVVSILDDETHVQLDQLLFNTFNGLFEPSMLSLFFPFILATIVSNSGGTLNLQYENPVNAKTLLEVEVELLEKLKDAWTKKKLKEIRNLSAIYIFNAVY